MTTLRVQPAEVVWLPWSADAFARARAEHKPILLSITTTWSAPCAEMDRTSYAAAAVAYVVNDCFVAIRVDADRRPDISERYSLGGWPTTAFLTPDGDLLGGGTFVSPERMLPVLEHVCAVFATRPAEAATVVPPPAPHLSATALPIEAVCQHVFDLFDEDHAGFGTGPKFPHAAPLHLALAIHRQSPQPRLEAIVTRTLDAIGWGPLYDDTDGGFFRFSSSRDWQQPQREKILEVNAATVRVFLDAAATLNVARFAERATDALRFVQDDLADQDGGWHGSRAADGRLVDRALYADANASMASAALAAATMFDDEWLRDFAVKSLERVLLACYKPGHGVAHFFENGAHVRGLLADQVAMAAAQLDAFEVTGNVVYEMMAEELAHYAIRELWDPENGAFFDRIRQADGKDIGLLRVGSKPFVTNCEAAMMLKRLAATSGDADFSRFASDGLAAVAGDALSHGPLAAHFALATL